MVRSLRCSLPVQKNRPFKWLNWDAARVLDMLRGSYLFELDDKRIIQDPESLRASSIRQGSAWQAWAGCAMTLVIQMNSSDHNPAIRVGASPRGFLGRLSHPCNWRSSTRQGQRRAIMASTATFSRMRTGIRIPWPMASRHSASRSPTWMRRSRSACCASPMHRFFTTVIALGEQNRPASPDAFHLTQGSEIDAVALMQEIQGLINPVPAGGQRADSDGGGPADPDPSSR